MFPLNFIRTHWLGLLATTVMLTGCASTGSSESTSGRIKITSEPIGAAVFADNTEIGTTPLEVSPSAHFRSGFVGLSYRYTGKLSIKQAGCETWSTEVNDYVLSKDVHAKLKCDPNYQPVAAQPAGAAVRPAPSTDEQPAERLERIESLYKKGLISADEYKQLRQRVLEKL